MGFLDFIFDNLFIVIIIVAGIINFLGRGNKKEKSSGSERQVQPKPVQQRSQQQPQRQQPQTLEERMETMTRRVEEKIEDVTQQFTGQVTQTRKTAAEQHQEQIERLRQGIKGQYVNDKLEETHTGMGTLSRQTKNMQSKTKDTAPVHLHLNEQLSTSGLMESIIMAEVLGPPRARNPYQNIAVKRMRK